MNRGTPRRSSADDSAVTDAGTAASVRSGPDSIPMAGPLQIGDPVRAAVARASDRRILQEADLPAMRSNLHLIRERRTEVPAQGRRPRVVSSGMDAAVGRVGA